MKKGLYILLIILVAGCSKSAPVASEENNSEEQTAVSFESDYDWPEISDSTTRGEAKTGFNVGDEIGVLAYLLEDGESIDGVSPNFMYNQLVTYQQVNESFAWVYSPVKYWPTTPTDRLQFFAFYPYSIDNITEGEEDKAVLELTASNTDQGYPGIFFTQAVALENQIDFMTSQTAQLEKCDNIPLPFSHQLTQVAFAVRHNGVSTDKVIVTELILKIDDVKLSLEGTFDDTQFNATTTGDATTLNYVLDGDYLQSGNSALIPNIDVGFYKTVSTDKGTLMLPPQTIGADCVTITTTIEIDRGWNEADEEYIAEKVITLNVPSVHYYVAGEVLIYQFTIDLETTELSFDVENILREAWKEGSEITEYTENTEDTGGAEIW